MNRFAIVAAAALLAAPAYAEKAQLTGDKVREFIDQASLEAQELVKKGAWRGIQSWHAEHLTGDARLGLKAALVTRDGPVMNLEATMNRDTLDRFAHMLMVSPEQVGPKTIEDFTLKTEVENVTELPGGEASATVIFHEAGTIAVAAPGRPGEVRARRREEEERPGIPTERVVFQTTSMCDLRLSPMGEKDVQIKMAACETVTTMG